nr:MAG TPA: hypothetical protein [Caudoviricetes sp.]DAT12370.1 MAG TPA: hypothetical protein [Caudoviricetes sp.]
MEIGFKMRQASMILEALLQISKMEQQLGNAEPLRMILQKRWEATSILEVDSQKKQIQEETILKVILLKWEVLQFLIVKTLQATDI